MIGRDLRRLRDRPGVVFAELFYCHLGWRVALTYHDNGRRLIGAGSTPREALRNARRTLEADG